MIGGNRLNKKGYSDNKPYIHRRKNSSVFLILLLVISNFFFIPELNAKAEGQTTQELTKSEILDVSFGGAFSTEKGYTNPTGEIMDGELTRRSGNETIDQGKVILNGDRDGINFQPRDTISDSNTIERPVIIETEFNLDSNPKHFDTLIAVGGNLWVRFVSETTIEYGFDVNSNGSWSTHKETIKAPSLNEDHTFAIAYIPTDEGAEMRAFLDGIELPTVSSTAGGVTWNNNVEYEIGFGNDIHPAGLDRGLEGFLSRVVLTSFEGDFDPSLLKTMTLSSVDKSLAVYAQGAIENGIYSPSDDEISKGELIIEGGEISGLGRLLMSGNESFIQYTPEKSFVSNEAISESVITEIIADVEAITTGTTMIDIGGAITVQKSKSNESFEILVNDQIETTVNVKEHLQDNYVQLSLVYEKMDEGNAEVSLWIGKSQVGESLVLSESPKMKHNSIFYAGTNVSSGKGLMGEVYGLAFASMTGEFKTSFLSLQGGPCIIPTDLEPGYQINITENECQAALAAKASLVRPTPKQVTWQQYEQTAFIHYGINTYYGVEWGDLWVHDDPTMFNPTDLNTDQWAKTLKDSGFKMAVLTVKHHDGFALYPTRYTDFSVASSPWKDGNGDVLRDFTESMHKHGIKVGVYLSPADHGAYRDGIFANGSERSMRTIPTLVEGDDRIGKQNLPTLELPATDYGEMFLNQLYEVLTEYGEVDEIWFDGAQGNIPGNKEEKYDWDSYYELINELAPNAVIAVTGPDVRWVGNESGWARENEWSVLGATMMDDGRQAYYPSFSSPDLGSRKALTDAAANGMNYLTWWPSEVDVSIRPGWFYHDNQQPKSIDQLRNIYYESIARNSVLLLNIPPDKRGQFAESDVERLKEWHQSIKLDFAINHAKNAVIKGENGKKGSDPSVVSDGNYDTSWESASTQPSSLTFQFNEEKEVERIVLQENINHGQQVESFAIDVLNSSGEWEEIYKNESIGYKRIVVLPKLVKGQEFRVRILQSRGNVHISEIGFYQTGLENEKVDVTELEELIVEAKTISNEEGVYTEDSFALLEAAIKEAEEALGTIETEDELVAALEALQKAINGLEEAETPKEPENLATQLEALILQAKQVINENTFTKKSLNTLEKAIMRSEKSLNPPKNDKKLRKEMEELQDALDNLVVIDVIELEALLIEAEALTTEEGNYTKKSFKELQHAIRDAEKELEQMKSEKEIDTALEALQAAIDGLVKK